jgi:hypothetical protein
MGATFATAMPWRALKRYEIQPLDIPVLQERPATPDNSQHAMAYQMAYQETQKVKNPK